MAPKPVPKGTPRRGRPPGEPTKSKLIAFKIQQIQALNALIETSTLGRPTFTSIVQQAVDNFVRAELAKPTVRRDVDQHLKTQCKGGLRVVGGDES